MPPVRTAVADRITRQEADGAVACGLVEKSPPGVLRCPSGGGMWEQVVGKQEEGDCT